MTFYERMDALATRQITAKGSEITIQSSPTAGDPVTGLGASDGATRTVTAVVTGIDYKTFPETLVQVGDKMLLIDEVVQVGERWVDGGAEYSVVATKEIKPDNSTFLVCKALVRG